MSAREAEEDMRVRLALMANSDAGDISNEWDLSPNDRAAIKWALDRLGRLETVADALCHQSWQAHDGTLSPTARRIAHSIDADHTQLISSDDFFYERPDIGYRDSAMGAKDS